MAPYTALLSHSRFFLNLRSAEGTYHSLILFRLADAAPPAPPGSQLYAMEAACPHLGADMSHADIEEYDTGVVAVCPWHRCAPRAPRRAPAHGAPQIRL